jgi:hypothetical protein
MDIGEGLTNIPRMTFDVVAEPADTPGMVDITLADS